MEQITDQYAESPNDDERTMFGTRKFEIEDDLLGFDVDVNPEGKLVMGFDEDRSEEFDYRIPDDVLNIEDMVYRKYSGSRSDKEESRVLSVLKRYFPYSDDVSYHRVSATMYRRETKRNQGTELASTDVEFIKLNDLPSPVKKLVELVGYSDR